MMLLKSRWGITPIFNRPFAFQTHSLFALHSHLDDRRRDTSPRPKFYSRINDLILCKDLQKTSTSYFI